METAIRRHRRPSFGSASLMRLLERWPAWARSLEERHRRLGTRIDPLERTLLRRLPLVWLVSRRIVASMRRLLQPQVHLAVHAVLRELRGWQRTPLLSGATVTSWLSVERRLPAGDVASNPPREHGRFDRRVETSLERVLVRLERGFMMRNLPETSGQVEVHSIALRISRRSQRLEEKALRIDVMTARTPSARRPSTDRTASRLALGVESSANPGSPTRVPPRTRAELEKDMVSTVNLERITHHVIQQLDRRVIAMRERMGRV